MKQQAVTGEPALVRLPTQQAHQAHLRPPHVHLPPSHKPALRKAQQRAPREPDIPAVVLSGAATARTPRADVVVSCRCCCLPLRCHRLRLVPGSTVETLASPDGAELGSYQRPQNDLTSLDPPPPHPPRSSSSTPSTLSRALLSLPTPARQRVCSRRLLLGLRPIPSPRPITSSAALARHGCHDLCPRHPRHAHRHQDPVPRPDQEAQAAPQGPRCPCPPPQGTLSLLQARQPHSAALATARC
jgi:hypothetical protein